MPSKKKSFNIEAVEQFIFIMWTIILYILLLVSLYICPKYFCAIWSSCLQFYHFYISSSVSIVSLNERIYLKIFYCLSYYLLMPNFVILCNHFFLGCHDKISFIAGQSDIYNIKSNKMNIIFILYINKYI